MTMKEEVISACQLSREIDTITCKQLVLDCRPFSVFNMESVRGAVNAFCPPIMRRRFANKGYIRLESVVSPDIRKKLKNGDYSKLVLYDDGMDTNTDIHLILQGLHKQSCSIQTTCVFKGGFSAFRVKYPQYCERHRTLTCAKDDINDRLCIQTLNVQSAPTELLPHLYIGDESHAADTQLLHRIGITAILNVSTSCPDQTSQDFTCKRIPIRDNESENISTWFIEALQFIESVKRVGGKILVHCKAGISRSATICIAYLMVSKSLTLDQAFDHIQARRQIISPNMSFMQQLVDFERKLLLTNMSPIFLTSSQTVHTTSCAHTSELSPSINTQVTFNFCAMSNS